jgi:hypothetical protein
MCFGEYARATLELVGRARGHHWASPGANEGGGPLFGLSKSVLVKLLTVVINKMYTKLMNNNDFVRILC